MYVIIIMLIITSFHYSIRAFILLLPVHSTKLLSFLFSFLSISSSTSFIRFSNTDRSHHFLYFLKNYMHNFPFVFFIHFHFYHFEGKGCFSLLVWFLKIGFSFLFKIVFMMNDSSLILHSFLTIFLFSYIKDVN
jgi:hypothetical protein